MIDILRGKIGIISAIVSTAIGMGALWYIDSLIRDSARNEVWMKVAKRSQEVSDDAEKLRRNTLRDLDLNVYRELRDTDRLPFFGGDRGPAAPKS